MAGILTHDHGCRSYPQAEEPGWRHSSEAIQARGMEDQQNLTWLGQLQYQAGVVSRQQALDAGFTAKAIEWRLRTGAWRRVHHGVYATFTGNLSREARLWTVVLRLGSG